MFQAMDHIVLRRARSEDAARIARLYIDSQAVDSTAASRASLDQATVQRWARTTLIHDEVWVLEEEFGRLVGVLALSGNELEILDVTPSLRRRGLGGRLVEQAKSRRPGGLTARLSQPHGTAHTFLLHHGFSPAPRGNGTVLNWRTPRGGATTGPFRVVSTASGSRA